MVWVKSRLPRALQIPWWGVKSALPCDPMLTFPISPTIAPVHSACANWCQMCHAAYCCYTYGQTVLFVWRAFLHFCHSASLPLNIVKLYSPDSIFKPWGLPVHPSPAKHCLLSKHFHSGDISILTIITLLTRLWTLLRAGSNFIDFSKLKIEKSAYYTVDI